MEHTTLNHLDDFVGMVKEFAIAVKMSVPDYEPRVASAVDDLIVCADRLQNDLTNERTLAR